jgi:hypothetical protein
VDSATELSTALNFAQIHTSWSIAEGLAVNGHTEGYHWRLKGEREREERGGGGERERREEEEDYGLGEVAEFSFFLSPLLSPSLCITRYKYRLSSSPFPSLSVSLFFIPYSLSPFSRLETFFQSFFQFTFHRFVVHTLFTSLLFSLSSLSLLSLSLSLFTHTHTL